MARRIDDGVEDLSGPTPGSAYAGMARDEYERKIAQRNARETGGSAPEAATVGEGLENAGKSMGASMASSSAQQGDALGTLGGAAMMSGNPYLMAAGLGLQVYSAGEKNKRAAQEQQRQEYNARVERRQEMLARIANTRIE